MSEGRPRPGLLQFLLITCWPVQSRLFWCCTNFPAAHDCLSAVLILSFVSVWSFKCYVCAPDEGKPEDIYTLRKSFPAHHLQSCSKYNKSNKHLYLLDCPAGNTGCLTKFEGEFGLHQLAEFQK